MLFKDLDEQSRIIVTDLGITLKSEFDNNEKWRRDKEREWVQSLRQCKGIYDPEVLSKIPENASKIYVKYTRYKEFTLKAILNNILFNDNDKNWIIRPTPKPLLANEILRDIEREIENRKKEQLLASGITHEQLTKDAYRVTKDELEEAIKTYALERCYKMEREIEDQLVDLEYIKTQKEIIKSGIRFGTGILEGTFSQTVKTIDYKDTKEGFKQVSVNKHMPTGNLVRVWDWYPDLTATDIEDCDFVWVRLIVTKHQLRQLAKRDDFYSDIIYGFIKDHPKGNATYKQWELDVETIDKEIVKDTTRINKYEILSRWGYVDGLTLKNVGIEVSEDEEDIEFLCNMYLLGNKVIKFIKSPLPENMSSLKDIYHIFYFEKDETSIFGTGLPKISRDMELTMGGAMRTTLNNAALVGGQQTEINVDLLSPDEDPQDFHPWRIWKRWGRGVDAQYQAIRPINFNSHITELMTIFDKAMMIADLELSMPMWMHNEPEKIKKQSLGQSSTKWQLHTISLKDIVKFFDECNESFLKSLYKWNMEFNEDDSIKGDCNIKAKGSTALLMKELKMQAINYFVQTLSPDERLYIKTEKFLKERMKLFMESDIDEFMRTEEEVEAKRVSMIDEEAIKLAKEKMKAEIIYEMSKAKHMEAKASKTAKDSDLNIIEKMTAGTEVE